MNKLACLYINKEVESMFYQDGDSKEYIVYEQEGFNRFLTKVFKWMLMAVLTSGAVAYGVVRLLPYTLVVPVLFVGIIAQIIIVLKMFKLEKLSLKSLFSTFAAYSVTTGITMSVVYYKFSVANIVISFFSAAVFFGVMALYGATTKKDLSEVGSIGFVGLMTIIILTIVNIFLRSSMLNLLLAYAGVAVFLGLTAYDIKKLKDIYCDKNGMVGEREILMGSFTLYLDFMNLFIRILEILGREKK